MLLFYFSHFCAKGGQAQSKLERVCKKISIYSENRTWPFSLLFYLNVKAKYVYILYVVDKNNKTSFPIKIIINEGQSWFFKLALICFIMFIYSYANDMLIEYVFIETQFIKCSVGWNGIAPTEFEISLILSCYLWNNWSRHHKTASTLCFKCQTCFVFALTRVR